ncbi:MAG: hypothetical protein OXG04_26795 [Acidobacteria bacterium]|nr:hypothetical protein [Acidobacteriota bacterium]
MRLKLAAWRLSAVAAFAAACGGGGDQPGALTVPDPEVVAVGPVGDAGPGSAPASGAVLPAGRDVQWYVSRGRRALDGLENIVVYRAADAVSGAPDVVLYARCLGDRTEVEIDMGVFLGDDVISDGDVRTKRVLVRFVPADLRPLVDEVGPSGRSLIVDLPLAFPRELVGTGALVVQTVSARGTAEFAEFAVSALAYQNLLVVSEACGWILDADEAERGERLDEAELLEAERAEVLASYVSTPVREGLERFGVEYGEVFLDLPAPVERAFLGFGVTVSAVEVAMAQGLGIVCLTWTWVGNGIVLRECYVEGQLEGVGGSEDDEPVGDAGDSPGF